MTNETPPLAVDGGSPLWQRPFPEAPVVAPAISEAPARALEAALAEQLGVGAAGVIAFGSHQAAYDAAFAVAGVTGGEVIVPALLGQPLADAASRAGARVVPGEVETDTGALSARGVARAVSPMAGTTSAVAVAHAFGHPAAMNEILAITQQRGLAVIEDCSDALGAAYRQTTVGRFGVASVFALGAGHVLSPAGAALLVVPNPAHEDRAERARSMSGVGLDDVRASVALAELRGLAEALEMRRQLAWELTFNVRLMRGLVGMPHSRWIHHAYDRYVIRLRALLWKRSIEDTVAAIRAEGVPCEVACAPSLHLDPGVRAALSALARATGMPGGEDNRINDTHFASAGRLSRELIAIPLHANLTSKDMDDVAQVLRKVERWST
ncbi:MAG: DegT/DnrJ/EryC1/StrS family aminotransferase [Chloroflexota bacterium]